MTPALIFAAIAALNLSAATPDEAVIELADAWVEGFASTDPLEARLWGVDTPADRLIGAGSLQSHDQWNRLQGDILARLEAHDPDQLGPEARSVYVNLRHRLEVHEALQSCHRELWPLNHVAGWQLNLINSIGLAAEAAGPQLGPELIGNWGEQISAYIDASEARLLAGLAQGYSTPREIADIVAGQFDSLAAEGSDLWTLADPAPADIATAWRTTMADTIAPRLAAHAGFIRTQYSPSARTALSIAALPEGDACYAASLFQQTGIRFRPDTVRDLGHRMQDDARTRMMAAARPIWGELTEQDIRDRLAGLDTGPAMSEEASLTRVEADTQRLIAASQPLFPPLPAQSVRVELYPPEQRAYMAASYRPDLANGLSGIYSINPLEPRLQHARSSEQVTAHETAPGHHTQSMVAAHYSGQGDAAPHPILTIGMNNAFVEGWAHYAEILAAEEGLLEHAETEAVFWSEFGATLPLAIDFNTGALSEAETAQQVLARRGTPDADLSQADTVLHWLAMMPGQIVSYEVGADFFYRQRDRARDALGDEFDYPTFHRLVLEEGSVPLWRVEDKIDAWIATRD